MPDPAHAPPHSSLAGLHPASFSMVMATGIVSVAAQLEGWPWLARALLVVNVPLYLLLWGLTVVRLARYPQQVHDDLLDHSRCVGFFTTVAATCVLGNQFLVVVHWPAVAMGLWLAGIVLWLVATYTVFTLLTVKPAKPDLAAGINGSWLVAVVATQAVASLGGFAAQSMSDIEVALFFSLAIWLSGGVLYLLIIVLIFYRYTFFVLAPEQLSPPYWINMGAMAITTLAGTALIGAADRSPLLAELLPFLKGLTLASWATATWWIPLLLVLGAWRHIRCRVPLSYDVVYWSMVFPLGMYTACTRRLSVVIDQPWLASIPRYSLLFAIAAWAITAVGLVRHVWRMTPAAEPAA